VEVLVCLAPHQRDPGVDAEDVTLEGQARRRKREWLRPANEVGDRRVLDGKQAWSVLQRLDGPPLDPALHDLPDRTATGAADGGDGCHRSQG
jgi:hypothetical protein